MMRPIVVSKRADLSLTSMSSSLPQAVRTRKTLRPSTSALESAALTRTMTLAWMSTLMRESYAAMASSKLAKTWPSPGMPSFSVVRK